jgi:hypothetical protein
MAAKHNWQIHVRTVLDNVVSENQAVVAAAVIVTVK